MFVENHEVNSINIISVARDYGMFLEPYKSDSYKTRCPNPYHNDKNLGNCYVTSNGKRNCVKCFSCGVNYEPIALVMVLENKTFQEAKEDLISRYNLGPIGPVNKPKSTWTGLTAEEYEKFGLFNGTIVQRFAADGTPKDHEKMQVRRVAIENPDLHDEILIGKFLEKMEAHKDALELSIALSLFDDASVEEFNDAYIKIEEQYKKLLRKGLRDKSRYKSVFVRKEKAPSNEEAISDETFAFDMAKHIGSYLLSSCAYNAASEVGAGILKNSLLNTAKDAGSKILNACRNNNIALTEV